MSQLKEPRAELTLEQKRALVARLLKEKADRSASVPVHRRIEEQVVRTPDTPAVRDGSRALTYRQLNARANQIARRLRELGVGPEVLVGIGTGRTVDMVAAVLAVLKAGGAYVPLDPSYPDDRLAFMLADSGAAILITEETLRDRWTFAESGILLLDSDETGDETDLEIQPDPANLAYVIYTSGSTGQPKGVQIPHAALSNLLGSMRTILGIASHDAVLAVTTLSFDIAVLELLLPLVSGGRVELLDRESAADGSRLIERLDHPEITYFQATPATWRMVLEAGWRGKPGLKMLCGGEAMPRGLADRLVGQGAALWNLYGPTETTIWSSVWRVEPGEGPISIGKPISDTQIYVLDRRMRPAPPGVTGELYIGGLGLARGYRGRPALTAERFVPDPFARRPGARLYRTGDLARWRPDGTLECLGRVDHQVKIRGFRIELGEIESALSSHPAIREAAVVTHPDASGEMGLAAYLVPRAGEATPAHADLRAWLHSKLPEYMIPSVFLTLESMPMTPNGKIDRNALPEPARARQSEGPGFVPPRGPIEEALAETWADLLGARRIGAHDSFFDIGGHSLMVMKMLARVRALFEIEVPLKDFIEGPTLANLARLVERALVNDGGSIAPPIERVDRSQPLPASFAQHRLWFLDQWQPGSPAYNIPIAVRLDGPLDVDTFRRALHEIVRRHEILRSSLTDDEGEPRLVIAEAIELPMPVDDLSMLADDQREKRIIQAIRDEATRPFDLAHGPLVRAQMIRLSEERHIVQVTMHHIVSDGWSLRLLIRELSALYEAFRAGEPSPLPELPIQYADFASWQRAWLQGDVLEQQLAYWKEQLTGIAPIELPTDRPRPAAPSRRGDFRRTVVARTAIDAVRALGREEGATLYMTLLAAFQTLLHRYSGDEDIAVGSPIAGRNRPELEGLIGFFANTLVLRGNLSGDPGFRELLRRTRRAAIDAYAHQEIPFERVVTAMHTDRDSGRSPLFQVMFVYQNDPLPTPGSSDLTITPLETPLGTAKFDLTLFADESPEGLGLVMEYSTDLFDPATIDRMLAHFRALLEAIVAEPDRPIGLLPMLAEDERQLVMGGWAEGEMPDADHGEDLDAILDQLSPR